MKVKITLLLLFAMLAVACYEPADLTAMQEERIPCVYCVLNATDTQYLRLTYLSGRAGGIAEGINDAEVLLSEFALNDSGEERIYRTNRFSNIGNGLYRVVLPLSPSSSTSIYDYSNIAPDAGCALLIRLSTGDTLRAITTMPRRKVQATYPKSSEKPENFLVLNGWKIPYPSSMLEDGKYQRWDMPGYVLSSPGAVWVSKRGWSKEDEAWFTEEMLATDRDDLTDAFNVTGRYFTSSEEPRAQEVYPGVVGKPLHYRYLRLQGMSESDTLLISGDFRGPHYGVGEEAVVVLMKNDEAYFHLIDSLYNHKIWEHSYLFTGKAGYLNFKCVSDEYDRYLKDVLQFQMLHEAGTDIVAIYDNTNIYSNIKGGIGVFGAEVEQNFYWTCGVWKL